MTYTLFPSSATSNTSAFDLESALPEHIHLLKSTSPSTYTPTMTLLYRPSTSGHWHATADDETYETVSDLLGVRMPMKAEHHQQQQLPKPITTVELQGQTYQVPDPRNKQFYRDLTYLSDDEMIMKYRLVPYIKEKKEYKRASKRFSMSSKSSGGSSLRSM